MLHDIDAAVAEVRWAHENGLTGGVLLPGTPPGGGLPQLHDIDVLRAALGRLRRAAACR